MSLAFGTDRAPRRPNLTPMIDVVFLLLVFFMLASRFGVERSLPLASAGAGQGYSGPPRLISVTPEALALNGVPIAQDDLAPRLATMTESPEDTIVLRPAGATDLQRVVGVLETLSAAGFRRVVLLD